MEHMIETKDVSFEYRQYDDNGNVETVRRAVDHVDLYVKPGQFIAILGHNGSGKSTLAKHLNAILLPTEGTVWIDGKDTADQRKLLEIRRTTGMVFQNPDNQIIGSQVGEDVAFGPENLGRESSWIRRKVEESLRAVGMEKYRNKSPNHLSGGQKQRVAIAGTVAMGSRCIVLDEPTAMLDPVGRREVLDIAHRLNREDHTTVILITHYMEEVIDADYIYVMDHGAIAMEGTPREIFSRVERLQQLRLDVPQVTILAHLLKKAGLDIPDGILRPEELVDRLEELKKG